MNSPTPKWDPIGPDPQPNGNPTTFLSDTQPNPNGKHLKKLVCLSSVRGINENPTNFQPPKNIQKTRPEPDGFPWHHRHPPPGGSAGSWSQGPPRCPGPRKRSPLAFPFRISRKPLPTWLLQRPLCYLFHVFGFNGKKPMISTKKFDFLRV